MSQEPQVQEIVVRDIRMRFWSMVVFMVKWSIAAIPALLILSFLIVGITVMSWGLITSLTGALPHKTSDSTGSAARVPLGKVLKDSNPTAGQDLRVTEWNWSYDEHGARMISGTAMNVGSKTYSYARVDFDLYDKDGTKLAGASANTSSLNPGAAWTFQAVVLDDRACSARLVGTSGDR